MIWKKLFLSLFIVVFLALSLGCSYKPTYLQKSQKTTIRERWQVKKIDPSRLSPDETALYKKDGTPEYIRFYRSSSPRRERVYEWIYTEPIHFVTFIDGKQVDYIVLDDRTSPLKEKEEVAGPSRWSSQDIEWLGP